MKKIYLMGILVLGLVVVPGVIQLLLTGEAGILGVGFPLIPAAILVWIFFSKSRGPNLGFTEEIKAGVIEGIISGFVLVVGLLGIWQCMRWEDGSYNFMNGWSIGSLGHWLAVLGLDACLNGKNVLSWL